MSYPAHALLRFSGRWFATEEWSCGLRLITTDNAATSAEWVTNAPSLLVDVVPMVQAWFTRADSNISNKARLDKVELNAIGPNGSYTDPGNPNVHDFDLATAPTGPVATSTFPQITTVCSLRTAVLRGRGTHGRIYPPTATTATGDGRIPPGVTAAMADSLASLCEDIATLEALTLAGLPRVGVVSGLGEPGAARIVTRILVGDIPDTQRRRRGSFPELYAAHDVVT